MEATTIDQLCPEVLEEIFSHLRASDLKNCALVCKAWNEVIGASAETMEKFKIGFRLEHDGISFERKYTKGIMMESSDQSCRKYQNIKIWISKGSLKPQPSLDRFNFSQVKSLDLQFGSSGSIQLSKVMKLLSRMPLLKELFIDFAECTIDTSNALAVQLTKLKQLKVETFDDRTIIGIFDFIKANNVTEFSFHARARHYDAEIDAVAGFIKSKKSLAKLIVSTYVFTQLLRRHDFSGMNLGSLNVELDAYWSVESYDIRSGIVLENLRKSLIFNAHSLTSLSIPSRLISKKVLEAIFNRLTKLKTLNLAADGGSWMDNLLPNDICHDLLLENLTVMPVGAIDGLKTILQRAPQLDKLTLGHVTDDIMIAVAASAPRLVELRMCSLKGNLTGDQKFNELKTLKIFEIGDVGFLASLLVRCIKVEIFECDLPGIHPDRVIDILLQQKTLKHLRFKRGDRADRQIIFNKLKVNYGNLKSLELSSYTGEIITFDFPVNPAEWNVEQQEARFAAFKFN